MHTIQLPAQINAGGLLPFISDLHVPETIDEISVDFSALRRVTPAGLVALVAKVIAWRREGREVYLDGLSGCRILGYLQRMNVFRQCGFELAEDFARHDEKGRFVPVTHIDHPVETMGNAISTCLAPGGEDFGHPMAGLYDFAFYVMTEIGNNVRQHSAGLGYASAQVNRQEGFVRVAIADNGMGIRESFRNVGAPWSESATDATAIRKALEPRASCKLGDPNQGVGLTLVSELARLTQAWLLIVSGTGVLNISAGGEPRLSELPTGGNYRGTLMTMVFRQKAAAEFSELLHEAKVRAGLLRTGHATGRFQP